MIKSLSIEEIQGVLVERTEAFLPTSPLHASMTGIGGYINLNMIVGWKLDDNLFVVSEDDDEDEYDEDDDPEDEDGYRKRVTNCVLGRSFGGHVISSLTSSDPNLLHVFVGTFYDTEEVTRSSEGYIGLLITAGDAQVVRSDIDKAVSRLESLGITGMMGSEPKFLVSGDSNSGEVVTWP